MNTKTLIAVLALAISLQFAAYAQQSEEIITIYLVRHAEKELSGENPKDPALTACGEERSRQLASFLEEVELDVIFSTDYLRTKSTALPTSSSKEKVIQFYDPRKLEEFAAFLINQKQDALVVGHSNTTAVLAGLLVGDTLGAFDESIYNRIYQVVIYKDIGRLHVLHTSFNCSE